MTTRRRFLTPKVAPASADEQNDAPGAATGRPRAYLVLAAPGPGRATWHVAVGNDYGRLPLIVTPAVDHREALALVREYNGDLDNRSTID